MGSQKYSRMEINPTLIKWKKLRETLKIQGEEILELEFGLLYLHCLSGYAVKISLFSWKVPRRTNVHFFGIDA